MSRFKILAIDGGGLKGLYTISMLNEIEKKYCLKDGKLIGDYFNTICGTSTGGIITLAIANRIPMGTLLSLYKSNAKHVFHNYNLNYIIYRDIANFYYTYLCPIFYGYMYNTDNFSKFIDEIFGDKTLGDLHNKIYIPSYNLSKHECAIFNDTTDFDLSIKDVILSTTAAPIYFKPYSIRSGHNKEGFHIDGGIYQNDPALVGIIQSEADPTTLMVLSLGNVKETPYDADKNNVWHLRDLPLLFDTSINADAQFTKYCITSMIKKFGFVYERIENRETLDPQYNKIDNSNEHYLEMLENLGIKDFAKYDDVIEKFFVSV